MELTILEHTRIKQSIKKLTSQDLCLYGDSDCFENSGENGSANYNVMTTNYIATFVKGSLIRYTPAITFEFSQPLKLWFIMDTLQSEAVIVYLSGSAHRGLLVHLTSGRVALSSVEHNVHRLLENTTFLSGKINDGSPHFVYLEIGLSTVTTTVDISKPIEVELRFELPLRIFSVHVEKSEITRVPDFEGVMRAVQFHNTNILEEASKKHQLNIIVNVELMVIDPLATIPLEIFI